MATKQAVLDAGDVLNNQLDALSTNGNYSPSERAYFSALFAGYSATVQNFFARPAHSDESPNYDLPLTRTLLAIERRKQVRPGNNASQQSYAGAVSDADLATQAVTRPGS